MVPSEATEGIVSRVLSPTSTQTSLEAGTGCTCWGSIWLWNPVLSQVQAPASQAREVIRIHLTRFRLKESCSLSMNKHSNEPDQFQKKKTTVEPRIKATWQLQPPLHSFLGLQWGKMAYVGSKLQLSHRYWTKLLRTARLWSCHRKWAAVTAAQIEKVHSFEESTCKNWTEKGWSRHSLSRRKPDMPWHKYMSDNLSHFSRDTGGALTMQKTLSVTSSKMHLSGWI